MVSSCAVYEHIQGIDCSDKTNKLVGIISCGGIVRDASVVLFDSPTLGWIPTEHCVGNSIDVKSGWLEEMIKEITDD